MVAIFEPVNLNAAGHWTVAYDFLAIAVGVPSALYDQRGEAERLQLKKAVSLLWGAVFVEGVAQTEQPAGPCLPGEDGG